MINQPTPASPFGSLLLLAWVLALFYLYGTVHYAKQAWAVFVLPVVIGLVGLSLVTQEPAVIRLLPLEVVEEEAANESDLLPLYEYEPEPAQVLDALLPRYIESRIFAALLQAAASELAARQRAMKSAGDNANELIKKYTRLRNNARQAEITQELTEIVGGADALSAS